MVSKKFQQTGRRGTSFMGCLENRFPMVTFIKLQSDVIFKIVYLVPWTICRFFILLEGETMPKRNNPDDRKFEECVEDCYYSSKFCYEKSDGTPVCPIDYQKCVDECKRQHSPWAESAPIHRCTISWSKRIIQHSSCNFYPPTFPICVFMICFAFRN